MLFVCYREKENAGKKVFVCNGSACLCAGTQEKLHHELGSHFKPEEIGHICCLGRCHEGNALQYEGRNYSGQTPEERASLFKSGKGDAEDGFFALLRTPRSGTV